MFLWLRWMALLLGVAATAEAAGPISIVVEKDASSRERLAASEVRRYLYVRTGELPEILRSVPRKGQAVVVATADRKIVRDRLKVIPALDEQEYILKTADDRTLVITGGSDTAVLYGAYRFAEHLGVRFYLHGDVIPDGTIPTTLPTLDDRAKPLFGLRGIQPFHDFCEGPDWWNTDDYKVVIGQLAKLRMNFIGLHTYPENAPMAEPTVWIGLPNDVGPDGRVTFSYPSSYQTTLRALFGNTARNTSEFACGASQLFEEDAYGSDVMHGVSPYPTTMEQCNQVFNDTAQMLRAAFELAHDLGVKTCVGAETTLKIPQAVKDRIKDSGGDPDSAAALADLYKGIFTRIARSYPLDYYWLWTPEGWTWEGAGSKEAVQKTVDDMMTADAAAKAVKAPFKLATCGWVLGPEYDRSMWDRVLPKDWAVSCISRSVGKTPVDAGFRNASDREKWAIPWLEDDPSMTAPQLWVGRMRRDAHDALDYGCTGLFGIHWRTHIIAPNVAALARAGWDQRGWGEMPTGSGPAGGSRADFSNCHIEGTEDQTVYQTVLWGMTAYRVPVPNGSYAVTLRFSESCWTKPGLRVFDVSLQGKKVIEDLDIFAKVGGNRALDYTFQNVAVTDGIVDIGFAAKVENPLIAAIEIVGPSAAVKINCAGPAYKDYVADMPPVDTFAETDDFYTDWATAEFGTEIAKDAAAIFSRIDCHLPEPCTWNGGPGGIVPNGNPWETVSGDYAFVDELLALRSRVKGKGSLSRFDYWLNAFNYMRSIAHLETTWAQFLTVMEAVKAAPEPVAKAKLARESALPLRVEMMDRLSDVYRHLLAYVDTPGDMGTIGNWEQHVMTPLHAENRALEDALGVALPPEAMPAKEYHGPDRLIVPTVRTSVAKGESLKLKTIVLSGQPGAKGAIYWRELGKGKYREIPLTHVARGVYTVTLPPAKTDIEYYVKAVGASGAELYFPATAPARSQTMVVMAK